MSWSSSPAVRFEVDPYRPDPPPVWLRFLGVIVNLLIWPGIGHFVMGRFARGAFWIAFAVICMLSSPLVLPLSPPVIAAALLGPRVLSALDATFARQGRTPTGNQLVLAILVYLVAIGLVSFLARRYYMEAFGIQSAGMAPTIAIGDHIFVNKLAYRMDDLQRGDVIAFFHPCEPDTIFIKRAVAVAGDTVEVRCDMLHVNGKAVPRDVLEDRASYWDLVGPGEWREVAASRQLESLEGYEYEVFLPPTRSADGAPESAEGSGERDFPGADLPSCSMYGDGERGGGAPVGRIAGQEGAGPTGACTLKRHYVVPEGHVFVLGDNRASSSDSRMWGPVPLESLMGKASGIWWSRGAPAEGIRWHRIGAIQ